MEEEISYLCVGLLAFYRICSKYQIVNSYFSPYFLEYGVRSSEIGDAIFKIVTNWFQNIIVAARIHGQMGVADGGTGGDRRHQSAIIIEIFWNIA